MIYQHYDQTPEDQTREDTPREDQKTAHQTTREETDTRQPTPCRQRDTLPDAPERPQSHFNALNVLETIKP